MEEGMMGEEEETWGRGGRREDLGLTTPTTCSFCFDRGIHVALMEQR